MTGALVRVPPLFICPDEPEPAHDGRSERFTLAARGAMFDPFCTVEARRSFPKPCGPRPRSVELPCASQLRLPAAGRFCVLLFAPRFVDGRLFTAPRLRAPLLKVRLPTAAVAEGGRLLASSR